MQALKEPRIVCATFADDITIMKRGDVMLAVEEVPSKEKQIWCKEPPAAKISGSEHDGKNCDRQKMRQRVRN